MLPMRCTSTKSISAMPDTAISHFLPTVERQKRTGHGSGRCGGRRIGSTVTVAGRDCVVVGAMASPGWARPQASISWSESGPSGLLVTLCGPYPRARSGPESIGAEREEVDARALAPLGATGVENEQRVAVRDRTDRV